MSEPQAGSDLASVRTRATPTASGWRLKGQKIWTTNADHSHYMIALVRTSGAPEDRQRGLSQLIIDLKTPGITVRPIEDLTGDRHFSEVFFDDVDLPHEALRRQRGLGLGAGDRRARVRAQRPRAALLEHRAARRLARASCARRESDDPAALALAGRIVGHTGDAALDVGRRHRQARRAARAR